MPHLRGEGEALSQITSEDLQIVNKPTLGEPEWYAAYTAPCREKQVAERFGQREIESFLPLYRLSRNWKNGCKVELQRPLFPGYIFVRIAPVQRVRVLEVPGVLSIIGRGRVPEPLDAHVIETLRVSIHLRKVEPHPYLATGKRVHICAGPLAGMSGIILRHKSRLRVVLTLDQIMQSMAFELPIEDLEPIRYGCQARLA
jgi:transcription antitermination factor NusG